MKILVIGAGVLGSLLTHALLRAGNDVTLMARGERKEWLLKNGLMIRHWLQLRTTCDRVKIVDRLGETDQYDLVLVSVRRDQLDDLLDQLSAARASILFVLLGNNMNASQTASIIQQKSEGKKTILFGFQGTAGRRENGKVISIHSGFSTLGGKMTLGSLDGDESAYPMIKEAFAKTKFKLEFNPNIDAWLKCHVAFVMPICFAVYYAHGDLRKIAGDKKFIHKVIDCMDEAYCMLQACGIAMEPPDSLNYVRDNRSSCYRLLRIMAATPIGKLAASDHAMTAKGEMQHLYKDFCVIKTKANISTPAWDELEKTMVDI